MWFIGNTAAGVKLRMDIKLVRLLSQIEAVFFSKKTVIIIWNDDRKHGMKNKENDKHYIFVSQV